MQIAQSLIILVFAVVCASPQQSKPSSAVSDEEFQNVLVAVSNEDWDMAVELSAKYLKQIKVEDERLRRLRYIYLYSAAGKVSEGRMEFDNLAQSVKDFIGKNVEVPYRRILLECSGREMNFICPSQDSKDKLMVTATNKTGTSILAFEYVQLKEPFDFASHENAPASISGRIKAIVPNPNKSRGLVMRFYISDATIILKETPPRRQISAASAGQQALAADGALACFSRKDLLSANADRAPQL